MMPIPPQSLRDELSARRAEEAERAGRDKTRAIVRTALACMGWVALGLFCLMWSAHTTDVKAGWIAVWAGLLIGNGGVVFTLLRAYLRGERRGYW
jgi:protein-S-isoprenylcysteine O-methyltransferase Ste14